MRYLILSLTFFISITHGTTCPHPVASMLRWGEIPTPWELNPFSAYPPQGEDGTWVNHYKDRLIERKTLPHEGKTGYNTGYNAVTSNFNIKNQEQLSEKKTRHYINGYYHGVISGVVKLHRDGLHIPNIQNTLQSFDADKQTSLANKVNLPHQLQDEPLLTPQQNRFFTPEHHFSSLPKAEAFSLEPSLGEEDSVEKLDDLQIPKEISMEEDLPVVSHISAHSFFKFLNDEKEVDDDKGLVLNSMFL